MSTVLLPLAVGRQRAALGAGAQHRVLARLVALHRCDDGPVFNLYHGAYYDAPPAVYLGYAYRPYYRYTAWHVVPRTYVCAER